MPSECYCDLLAHFGTRTVLVGTGRRALPAGSLGDWLHSKVTSRSVASYVAAILVREGYAERTTRRSEMRFLGRIPDPSLRPRLPGFDDHDTARGQ